METEKNTPLFKRVLAVDDSDMDLLIASMTMKKYVFSEEVVLKKSARSALEFLLSCESTPELLPQLIFLDINMPELSGFDFLDEYEKLPAVIHHNCLIMMLSTSMAEEDHIRATSNRFVSKFLNKPLDREKLDTVRSEVISGKVGKN